MTTMASGLGETNHVSENLPGRSENGTHLTHALESNIDFVERMLSDMEDQLLFNGRNYPATHTELVIFDFQQLIEKNNQIYMQFSRMFDEAKQLLESYTAGSSGKTLQRKITYVHLLKLLTSMLTRAPSFGSDPFYWRLNAVLGWPLATSTGSAAFTNVDVNYHIGRILRQWAQFLQSRSSRVGLNGRTSNGWFCPAAMAEMPDFGKTYVCNPHAPFYGFESWDDFYTRRLKPGARPIESPDDQKFIVSAYESTHSRLKIRVQDKAEFWTDDQPYSVYHMLAYDTLADQFVRGTVYQAFLSSTNYHRWHSPVDGRIVKMHVEPGSCSAITPLVTGDPEWLRSSPSFFAALATRAIIFIEASKDEIGLMCFMAIGSTKTSCEITVKLQQRVRKGEQLGMFHLGGFSYCLLFRPGTPLQWNNSLNVRSTGVVPVTTKVNERLAITWPFEEIEPRASVI